MMHQNFQSRGSWSPGTVARPIVSIGFNDKESSLKWSVIKVVSVRKLIVWVQVWPFCKHTHYFSRSWSALVSNPVPPFHVAGTKPAISSNWCDSFKFVLRGENFFCHIGIYQTPGARGPSSENATVRFSCWSWHFHSPEMQPTGSAM